MKKLFLCVALALTSLTATAQPAVTWDRHSLMIDGRRVMPVMGEVHYSRIPEAEWADEIRKMKLGGVTIIATYVFWNHVEEQEGIYNWSGQRNLRRFVELCKAEEMPVILRVGPFCHGEARNGGIPDWAFQKKGSNGKSLRMRSQDPVFLALVERLYRQIFTQVQGLQWKDGGPIMACQFDNEYRGSGDYLMALKKMALEIGFDLPFYTRTGWPELSKPVAFGEMLPLYGDYADGFWERSTKETAGSYWKAFHFSPPLSAGENMGALDNSSPQGGNEGGQGNERARGGRYPYFTCELGGGMMTSYHRRVYMYPEDAYSMALVKLGSGSNLLGYYMYHGGTNPESMTGITLNETQRTVATNYNDMPVKTYDFQAPLGEFGQQNPHYYMLRPLHLFMHDFGQLLAPMQAVYPQADKPQEKGIDTYLRWSYRSVPSLTTHLSPLTSKPAFVFINNYERLQNLTAKRGVQFDVNGVRFPRRPVTIPAGAMAILPVNMPVGTAVMQWATAQPVAQRDGRLYMMAIDGLPVEMCIDGKLLKNLKPRGTAQPVRSAGGIDIYLLTAEQAGQLFLLKDNSLTPHLSPLTSHPSPLTTKKLREAGAPRRITMGVNKAAEEPTDQDFEAAAVYTIDLPEQLPARALLIIAYKADCARLYADGRLIQDNFYNGRPMLYGLWRLPAGTRQLELRLLPMQKDMPVYFPREADTTPGEQLISASVINNEYGL